MSRNALKLFTLPLILSVATLSHAQVVDRSANRPSGGYRLKYVPIPPKTKPSDRPGAETNADDQRRQQPGESFEDWKIRHDKETKHAPPVMTNEQIRTRLGVANRDSRSPERVEALSKRREAYLTEQAEFKKKVAEWRADRAAERDRVDQHNRAIYDQEVKRQNRVVDAYNISRAQAYGQLDAAWELQRRTMEYNELLNGGHSYLVLPVFIGPYGQP